MTKDEIRDMQAGPEMDKIVAEKVTGTGMFSTPPKYSTEIAAAWDILAKFHWVNLLKGQAGMWVCTVRNYSGMQYQEYQSLSRQAPESICKAALLAAMTK